jgi:hypothetical protein
MANGLAARIKRETSILSIGSKMIDEHAHAGSMPIATLQDLQSPYVCAIDGKTGSLAIANWRPDTVAVYAGARGKPTRPIFSVKRPC